MFEVACFESKRRIRGLWFVYRVKCLPIRYLSYFLMPNIIASAWFWLSTSRALLQIASAMRSWSLVQLVEPYCCLPQVLFYETTLIHPRILTRQLRGKNHASRRNELILVVRQVYSSCFRSQIAVWACTWIQLLFFKVCWADLNACLALEHAAHNTAKRRKKFRVALCFEVKEP